MLSPFHTVSLIPVEYIPGDASGLFYPMVYPDALTFTLYPYFTGFWSHVPRTLIEFFLSGVGVGGYSPGRQRADQG